jgi:hypothetical protein
MQAIRLKEMVLEWSTPSSALWRAPAACAFFQQAVELAPPAAISAQRQTGRTVADTPTQ